MTAPSDAARRPGRAGSSGRSEFRLSESPAHLLRRAEQYAAEIFLKASHVNGITLRQTVLLAAITEAEGASQSDLVRATGVDRSTLAEMMARMERKGLIARSASEEDGRAKSVSLTPEGRARLQAAVPAMRQVDAALVAAQPRNKRASFRQTLTALASAADAAAADEAGEPVREKKPAKSAKAPGKARRQRKKKPKVRWKR
jgi:DNA-binding MarR family transcriptional regulator